MAVERLIGIDFGTSTSVIRVKRYENGEPIGEKLETKEVVFGGSGLVPTLIMKKDDDPSICYFGYEAQQRKKKFTNFQNFKMDLESDDPAKRAQAMRLTEEFYGYLAKQYKSQRDGGHLGNPDDRERTIISYPVKWTEETKAFMLETAKKAGFPNVTGMDEAQAAIQAVIVMSSDHLQKHGLLKNGEAANILLIDMGAGTTDLVLARYVPGDQPKTEVLNTWPKSGEILFGGREIDSLLQNFFREMLDEDDAEMVFRRIGSDKFKSWKEETVSPALRKFDAVSDFEVFDSCVDMMGIDLEEYRLDRTALENCLTDYLKQFPVLIADCLRDVRMSGGDVDLVIVTGGHSQWYFVNEMLSGQMTRFGAAELPKIRENPARIIPISRPQETVALGLAYQGIRFEISESASDLEREQPTEPEEEMSTIAALEPPVEEIASDLEPEKPSGKMDQVYDTISTVGGRIWGGVISSVRDVTGSLQQAAKERRQREQEEIFCSAPTMRTSSCTVSYTPESEFMLNENNEGYVISKYMGSRPVVSIPPMIQGKKVVGIGGCAFGGPTIIQGNRNLKVVVIPESVRTIGIRAFTGCGNLHTVVAHPYIEAIGESAFWGCDKLMNLDFGAGENIPGRVVFPPALQKIGPMAFSKAASLTNATYLSEIVLCKNTQVQNAVFKTFDPKVCSLHYYL